MTVSSILKTVGSAALAISVALPFSAVLQPLPPGSDATPSIAHYRFLLSGFSVFDPVSWAIAAAVFWPLVILTLGRFRGRVATALAMSLSPILVVFSGFVLRTFFFFATPAIGAYLSFSALALFTAGWFVETWRHFAPGSRSYAP